MKRLLTILIIVLIAKDIAAQKKPIALHPLNSHYFLYNGKPVILITSGEHYGAVMNLDFDYETYLNTLKADGLNLTRLFTGAYVEPEGAFKIEKNTLAPLPLKFICPWQRSSEPGYANGGNKFDLDVWNKTYFKRLKSFVLAAQKKNIIVELTFFCPFYDDSQWRLSPLNDSNNITHVAGNMLRTDVYTISEKTKAMNRVQADLVRKIATELNGYDNLVYELINEPYFGGVTLDWQHFIATLVISTESNLPNKHLLTQNIANGNKIIEKPDSLVSVFNFHYASPPNAVTQNYHLNKVIGCNETGFNGTSDSVYRLQAWQFILAGGGLFNNLDYSFTAGHEDGNFKYHNDQPGGGSIAFRKQLRNLKYFISSFNFIQMRPDSSSITAVADSNISIKVLAEKGKQYAVHILGGTQVQLNLSLPVGSYKISWINTITGKPIADESISVTNNQISLPSPVYKTDIALAIIRKK